MGQIHRTSSTLGTEKAHFGRSMGVHRHPGSRTSACVCRTGHTQMDPDLFLHMHTGEQW